MDIHSLEIFVTVAELGSASKAAEALHITQPAVSWSLNKMEQHYGIRFFDRSGHRMQLNEAGTAILPQAKAVLSRFSQFEAAVGQFRAADHLTVGFSFGQNLMLSYAREQMVKFHPELELCAVYGNSARIRASLLDGSLDLGIFALSRPSPEFQSVPLWEDSLKFVCSTSHPLLKAENPRFRDLLRYPAYLREPGHFARDTFDEICRAAGVHVTPQWQGAYNRFLIEALKEGSGYSLLSTSDLSGYHPEDGVTTLTLSDVQPVQSVVLAWKKDRILSKADRCFIRACQEISAETPME